MAATKVGVVMLLRCLRKPQRDFLNFIFGYNINEDTWCPSNSVHKAYNKLDCVNLVLGDMHKIWGDMFLCF